MNRIAVYLDVAVCFLWILTYLLVLIGTIRYKYPLISPFSQLFFGATEFAVLLFFIGNAASFHKYVIITYFFWALVEIAIFVVIFRTGHIKKRYILPYLVLLAVATYVCYLLIVRKDAMMFVNYFCTLCGVLLWLAHMKKRDYPYNRITLAAFSSKLLGDLISIPVNLRDSDIVTGLTSFALLAVDVFFIYVFCVRREENSESKKRYC